MAARLSAAPKLLPVMRSWDTGHVASDEQIRGLIERLETEREELRRREGSSDPTVQEDAARLEQIRLELDRLWDLLRQRQALRDAGDDPDKAEERPSGTVENYEQ
jgi:hypothetical protein